MYKLLEALGWLLFFCALVAVLAGGVVPYLKDSYPTEFAQWEADYAAAQNIPCTGVRKQLVRCE